ncbi:MAG TPA: Uma2 family endonuclease [Candidatus Nanopelagicales bacterium]|nr:Uma2 family endonuclease [Candidatus Nanopelagicales bacterium]
MAEPAERARMTPEEYLAFERASETKHEYADGETSAMAGGTREHSLISMNIARELGNLLRDRPCEVHGSDLRVKIAATGRYVYPDASVVCGAALFEDEQRDTLQNPLVVVEVLSDSTEAYDRGEKFEQYRSLPSLLEYVICSQKKARVEHFQRQGDGRWVLTVLGPGDRLTLESIGCELPVDDIYLKVFDRGAPPAAG